MTNFTTFTNSIIRQIGKAVVLPTTEVVHKYGGVIVAAFLDKPAADDNILFAEMIVRVIEEANRNCRIVRLFQIQEAAEILRQAHAQWASVKRKAA